MLILFFKAHVKAHTRRLKNGKVISVAAYRDKRGHQTDERSGDLFANVPARPHAIHLTARTAPHIHPVRRAIVLFQADFFNKKPLDGEQIVRQSIRRTPTPETANMTFTANRITQEQYPASEPFTIRHNNHALTKIEAAANAGDLDALLALEPAGISQAGQQVHAEWRRAVLHLGGPAITRTRRETAPAPTPAPTPVSDPDADLRRDAILHPMADASELEMARQGRAWYNGVLRPVDFDLIARMRTSTQATLAHLDQQQAWIEAGTDPSSILGSDWQVGSRNADLKDMGLQVVEQRRNRETSTLAGYERQHQRWQAANPLTVPPQQRGGLRVSALEQTGEPYDSHGIMYVPLKATVTIGTQTKQVTGIASSERIVIYDLIGRYPTGKPRKATVMIERATGRQDVYGGIGTGSSRSNNTMAIVGFEKIEPTPAPTIEAA